jgi:hypothetical protein
MTALVNEGLKKEQKILQKALIIEDAVKRSDKDSGKLEIFFIYRN